TERSEHTHDRQRELNLFVCPDRQNSLVVLVVEDHDTVTRRELVEIKVSGQLLETDGHLGLNGAKRLSAEVFSTTFLESFLEGECEAIIATDGRTQRDIKTR